MKLAMFQMANSGSVEGNLAKSLRAIEEAANAGADLILFPEVQLTEFFPQYPGRDVSAYRLTMESDVIHRFRAAAKEHRIMVVPNVYLCENSRPYDTSLLIGRDGAVLGSQKMVHVAQAAQFYEQDYYTPSDTGFQVFDTDCGTIGIVVCFDRHYPESIRTEALMGADLILVPTVNTKQEPMEIFEQEIRVQAFQNSVFVAMCNRVGREDDMDFAGESLLVDANGQTVCKADDTERLILLDADLREAGRIRASRPYTSLRRTELYL